MILANMKEYAISIFFILYMLGLYATVKHDIS